jgi:hypothetical protein
MTTALDQYRQAKNDYLKLRNQAKKELIARFNELASELFHIQRELLEDFGEKITIPPKAKKTSRANPSKQAAAKHQPPAIPSPAVISLKKQIERQKKKLSDTQAAGKPAKAVEDRIYELEDALRLAQVK